LLQHVSYDLLGVHLARLARLSIAVCSGIGESLLDNPLYVCRSHLRICFLCPYRVGVGVGTSIAGALSEPKISLVEMVPVKAKAPTPEITNIAIVTPTNATRSDRCLTGWLRIWRSSMVPVLSMVMC